MLTPTFACAALLGLAKTALALPVAQQSYGQTSAPAEPVFDKRESSGPEIGGANFADPAIIGANSRWYSFATRTDDGKVKIQVAESGDFETWNLVKNGDGSQKDALGSLPAWVDKGNPQTWAPDVIVLDDGTYVMYYSATSSQDPAKHCIGAAKSQDVTGPYTPTSDQPLICPLEKGGAIDAAAYNDNGQRYLTWKIDGNAIGHGGACGNTVDPIVSTPIRVQQLGNDGVTLYGEATTILDNRGASDQGVIEAPSLLHRGDTWYLFFSANCYTTENYNVNYATASSVTGPYTRADKPLFQTGDAGLTSPGGADIDHDGKHLLFHAAQGGDASRRAMYTAMLNFNGDTVSA